MEYIIKNDRVSVTVSSRGGELKRIMSSDGTDYLWRGDRQFWPGSAPHLFPFIGRLFEQRYTYSGESYPLSIHGFLKDSEMTLEEQQENHLVLRLNADEKTLECYPFNFTLKITYRLDSSSVGIGFEVTNIDEKDMPFAIGGHPGFNVPLEEGLSFEDYYLEFDSEASPSRAEPTASNLLNGRFLEYPLLEKRIIPLKHNLFDEDAIILKDTAKSVTLKSDRGRRALKVDFPDFKYIGFWHTVKSEAPFICIEPWTSLQGYEDTIQAIDKNEDLMVIKKGEVYRNEFVITIIE